jgi:hypothetical protein
LTDGTTNQQKIEARAAMDCAVRACRGEGSVIIAELSNSLGPLIALPLMVSLVFLAPNDLLQSMNWWQISLASIASILVSGFGHAVFLPFATRDIARSIAMKKLDFF